MGIFISVCLSVGRNIVPYAEELSEQVRNQTDRLLHKDTRVKRLEGTEACVLPITEGALTVFR